MNNKESHHEWGTMFDLRPYATEFLPVIPQALCSHPGQPLPPRLRPCDADCPDTFTLDVPLRYGGFWGPLNDLFYKNYIGAIWKDETVAAVWAPSGQPTNDAYAMAYKLPRDYRELVTAIRRGVLQFRGEQ